MRRTSIAAAALTAALGLAVIGLSASHSSATQSQSSTHGFDVSWPQCAGASARDMPAGDPAYVILGLTDGAGHTVNPCLDSQVAWARSHGTRAGAYLVPSYPTKLQQTLAETGLFGDCGTAKVCQLRNDGAAQATDALAAMRSAGLNAPRIWIDVEFRHAEPWSQSNHDNRAVLQGVVEGLRHAHMPMGVYTTSLMWGDITGGYSLNVPNWLPSGDGNPHHAKAMCTTTATGGVTWLVQYTRSLDSDLTCPVLDPVPGKHSKLWRYRHTHLQLFSRGRAVRAVQRVVADQVTGVYGAVTVLRVNNWEAKKGVPVTGTITKADWRAMGADRTYGGHKFWIYRIASPV